MNQHDDIPTWNKGSEHNPDPGQYFNSDGMLVSERKVMKSAAWYYIGRSCEQGPYSRESVQYFEAEVELSPVTSNCTTHGHFKVHHLGLII